MTIRSIFSVNETQRQRAFNSRVWLDGVEVTSDCQIADDENGRVLLLKRNSEGQHYVDAYGDPADEWKSGHVVIADKDSANV